MNTNQLRCFLAVADKLSFTKAAQELFFSVPTVTHHIQSLENELHAKLFVRSKKGVSLTDSGRSFYPAALDLLNRYDAVLHSIGSDTNRSTLKIGCTSHAELVRMTPVLKALRSQYPDVLPHVDTGNYDMILDMFEEQQLDVVFVTDNMLKKRKRQYVFHKLASSRSCAVMSSTNPLAAKDQLSFHELDTMLLIGLHPAFVPFESENEVKRLMQLHHLKHKDILVENDNMALVLCRAGYGIAVLPSYCIPEYHNAIDLASIPIEESQQMVYGAACHKDENRELLHHFIKLAEILYKKNR